MPGESSSISENRKCDYEVKDGIWMKIIFTEKSYFARAAKEVLIKKVIKLCVSKDKYRFTKT